MNSLARAYELGYLITHYEYRGLPDSVARLSWGEKILCKRRYYSEELWRFLATGEGGERKRLSERGETVTEKIQIGGLEMIVKREKAERSLFWLGRLFRMGRGVEIWNHAHQALAKKIPVLCPVAMVERGDETAVVYLCEGTDLKTLSNKELGGNLAKLLKALRSKGAVHHDLRLKNVVQIEGGELKLIDIDKFHFYPKLSYLHHYRLQREIAKFQWDWERKTHVPLKLFQEGERSIWREALLFLARVYEGLYAIAHYDYAGFTGGSWREKTVCKQGYEGMGRMFSMSGEVLHKRANRVTKKIEIDGKSYILKQEKARGFWRNLFTMTRGVSIWNNAHMAESLSFPVLKPVAMMERRGWREAESAVLYLMEGKEGSKHASSLVALMKTLCLIHHDFRPKNLVELPDHTQSCIDIDRLHRYPRFSYVFHARLKDEMAKFQYQSALQ